MNAIRQRRRSRPGGFTMIELMVVVAIIAVLATVAAPSFKDAILSNKLAGFANSFVSSVQLARSEAIKRNSTVRVCRSADGTSCATSGTWQQGWIVFHDINNDQAVSSGETVIQVQGQLSSDYHFTGDSYNIVFQPLGGGAGIASLILCRAVPSPGPQERAITVSPTGRASVSTTRTSVCT